MEGVKIPFWVILTDSSVIGIILACGLGAPLVLIGRLISSQIQVGIGIVLIVIGAMCLLYSTKDSERKRMDRAFYKASTRLNNKLTSKVLSQANAELQILIADYQIFLSVLITLVALCIGASLSTKGWISIAFSEMSIVALLVFVGLFVKYKKDIRTKTTQIKQLQDDSDDREINLYHIINGKLKSILIILALTSALALSLAFKPSYLAVVALSSLAFLALAGGPSSLLAGLFHKIGVLTKQRLHYCISIMEGSPQSSPAPRFLGLSLALRYFYLSIKPGLSLAKEIL